ncbi:protein of unknown function [Kyrpidia spormannii]|uniref:Uncharacterized protein n=1 Tax=Kyrpidia spormannii TaxID=2055160 RepID=A0A6F9ECU1_9BACL|nr:protein of unknown function [Kyrpidia spormannii]
MVPGAGLEPARGYAPTDFKSVASADSAIPAHLLQNYILRPEGLRPDTCTSAMDFDLDRAKLSISPYGQLCQGIRRERAHMVLDPLDAAVNIPLFTPIDSSNRRRI